MEVRRHGFDVSGRWAVSHLIDTLPQEWQDITEIIYDLLWGSAVPILLREIDYETFCAKLTALWEESWFVALEFLDVNGVPSEMNICGDAPPSSSQMMTRPRLPRNLDFERKVGEITVKMLVRTII
ncbi:Uncharacterized protein Adt_28452 [Abeliophyllum distichum]|uniref:Uncharacterized protein n=1 Tax=Abeliophyllum distichum TaxID=126358 RepID=A0ABD1RXV7_9LAMI